MRHQSNRIALAVTLLFTALCADRAGAQDVDASSADVQTVDAQSVYAQNTVESEFNAADLSAAGPNLAPPPGLSSDQDLSALDSLPSTADMPINDGGGLQPTADVYAPYRAATAGCKGCNGTGYGGYSNRYPYNRCGCNLEKFPWFTGPGNCDSWCVGPHWGVKVNGLMLGMTDVDWAPVIGAVAPPDPTLTDTFDFAAGARIALTGYNQQGYGMQVAYEGVNDYTAALVFPLVDATRAIDYESRMNSIEINFIPRSSRPLRFIGGFRVIEMAENFVDFTTVDKVIPVPADPPAASAAFVDTGTDYLVKNRLYGFQVGAFRDSWVLNQWFSIEGFVNAGIYYNDFRREEINRSVTTVYNGDDLTTPDDNEFSRVVTEVNTSETRSFAQAAFMGEASLTAICRLNRCLALRGGYQVTSLDGVGRGIDAFFDQGLIGDAIVYHGLHFGLEYRR